MCAAVERLFPLGRRRGSNSALDAILNESAVNLRDRRAAWRKAGWKRFDPANPPYGADEMRKERQLYGAGMRQLPK
jgi:hypothetical protein